MGSISRYSALERFDNEFGERLKQHYEKQLLGLTIKEIGELIFDYHKKADISLSDDSVIEVHFAWASEEEEHEDKEILEDGDIPIEEYFKSQLKGKTITKITTGYERDDEFYIYALVDDDNGLDIPIGFDPESIEYHGDEELISPEEFQAFRDKYYS